MKQKIDAERAEAIRRLKQETKLKPGERIWTILKTVNRGGDRRVIDLFVVRDRAPRRISHLAARATGLRFDPDQMGLVIHGGGMDMGFEAVYQLGAAMFPKGVRKDYSGRPNPDGGYAFSHAWF